MTEKMIKWFQPLSEYILWIKGLPHVCRIYHISTSLNILRVQIVPFFLLGWKKKKNKLAESFLTYCVCVCVCVFLFLFWYLYCKWVCIPRPIWKLYEKKMPFSSCQIRNNLHIIKAIVVMFWNNYWEKKTPCAISVTDKQLVSTELQAI